MDASFIAENAVERHRLERLAADIVDDDLRGRLDSGVTVAQILVHLAFWETYCESLLTQWESDGVSATRTNFDAVNVAVRGLADAILPRETAGLAVAAMASADRQLDGVSDELAAAVEEAGYARILHRAPHRRHHLDQIDRAIGR